MSIRCWACAGRGVNAIDSQWSDATCWQCKGSGFYPCQQARSRVNEQSNEQLNEQQAYDRLEARIHQSYIKRMAGLLARVVRRLL